MRAKIELVKTGRAVVARRGYTDEVNVRNGMQVRGERLKNVK